MGCASWKNRYGDKFECFRKTTPLRIGTNEITFQFIEFCKVIDVVLRIICNQCLSLVSFNNMIFNDLHLSINEKIKFIGDKEHSHQFKNIFESKVESEGQRHSALHGE